jgi:hypothetical protein
MRNERRHGNQREPARVSGESGTTQAGEVRARWAWVEPCVWTDRMLTTLETRVKGGMWSSDGPTRILPNAGCSPVTQSVGKKSVRGNGEPSTGEPYAGNPPVRFGGRGDVIPVVPTPIPLRAFPNPLRQRLSVFQLSVFQLFSSAGTPLPYPLTR